MKRILPMLLVCVMLLTSLPLHAFATTVAMFTIDKTTAECGEETTVAINIRDNPGIIAFSIKITYDTERLELVNVGEGDFKGLHTSQSYAASPYIISWSDATSPDNKTNGTVASLVFKVKDDAEAGDAQISLSYDEDNIYNLSFSNVDFSVQNGSVSVERHELPEVKRFSIGKVDENGAISSADTSLFASNMAGDNSFSLRFVLVSYKDNVAAGDKVELNFISADGTERVLSGYITPNGEVASGLRLELYTTVSASGVKYTAGEDCLIYGVVVAGIPYGAFETINLSVTRTDGTVTAAQIPYSTPGLVPTH